MTKFIKPLRSGQITIPALFREQLGISSGSLLEVTAVAGELRIKPIQVTKRVAGSPWVKELYDYFADVRKEVKAERYSGEAVNRAIDRAITSVRKKHAESGV